MGLFGLFKSKNFKSKEEEFRYHVRASYDASVQKVVNENADMIQVPMFGGMMVQAAIASVYQSLKNDPKLSLITSFEPLEIIEEECKRALDKYLK